MILYPLSRYVGHTDLFGAEIEKIIGNRFHGITTGIDGQFALIDPSVTLEERDLIDLIPLPVKKAVKINRFLPSGSIYEVPVNVDFVSGLSVKLHRKSIIVKGEVQREEFYEFCTNGVFSNLILKEETSFTRNALGFPLYKEVTITWINEDETENTIKKSWRSYYDQLEQIKEGKVRRGNLVAALQMPIIGLISISINGNTNATPQVILEGRRFLSDYNKEFTTFIEDSNKDILACLSDPLNAKYATGQNYTWIDSATPYGVTIRQYIVNEMTI